MSKTNSKAMTSLKVKLADAEKTISAYKLMVEQMREQHGNALLSFQDTVARSKDAADQLYSCYKEVADELDECKHERDVYESQRDTLEKQIRKVKRISRGWFLWTVTLSVTLVATLTALVAGIV